MPLTLPDLVIAKRLLVRAAVIWAGVRGCYALAVLLLAGVFGAPELRLPITTDVAIAALTVGLVLMEVKRRHEAILLANLGVPLTSVALLAAVPALVGTAILSALAP